MKRNIFTAVLIILVLAFAVSCKTAPSAADDVEAALNYVYDKYRGDIILDGAKSYTVVSGDTLAHISSAQYGNGFYFPLIMLASSDVVVDQDKIRPGMVLTVPDLQKNMDNATAKRRIKSYLLEIARIEDERGRPADAQGLRDLSGSL